MAIRTFICLELPPAERERLGAVVERARRHRARISWVPSANVHLTLAFLGDVDEERVPAVVAAVERAAAGREPLELRLAEVGAFPSTGRPRILWVGVAGDTAELEALQAAVSRELDRASLPRDAKPFRPHLTLGRVKDDRDPALAATTDELASARFAGEPFLAAEVVVMSSQLDPRGARHTPVASVALGREEAP
jgi:2'-5' RNA ligase